MKILRVMLLGAIVSMWSIAASSAVIFDVDGAGSSVSGDGCTSFFPCSFNTNLAAGLDSESFSLNAVGDSHTFEFLELSWRGAGVSAGVVDAVLAFSNPGGSANGISLGAVGFVPFGALGFLQWADIPDVLLPSGIAFNVDLQDLNLGAVAGNSVVVGATVTLVAASVPEPSSLVLLGFGALGLFGLRRKPV